VFIPWHDRFAINLTDNEFITRANFSQAYFMKWRVILEPDIETGDWAIWCPELPGCSSAGETEAEALQNIQEAIALYLEPAPVNLLPSAVIREVIVG
jgi:predicted RNase H-like HicB family nuclease